MLPLKKQNNRPRFPLISIIFLTVLLGIYTGCATAPKQKPASSLIDMLPEEQTVYLKLDVGSNEDVVESLLSGEGNMDAMIGEAMSRTEVVLISMKLSEGSQRSFSLVASGRYPKGIIESRLRKENAWKREKGEFGYWQNSELGLQIYFPEKNIIVLSNGAVESVFHRISEGELYSFPRELRHEFDISDLVFFMPDPGNEILSSVGGGKKIYPIRLIWVTIYGEEMDVVFLMDNEENAKKFSKVAKLLVAALMMKEEVGDLAALRENMKMYLDGKNVRLEDIPITRNDLKSFLGNNLIESEE